MVLSRLWDHLLSISEDIHSGHRIRIQRTPDTASSPQSTDLHTGPRNARLRQFLRDEESSLEYPRDGGDDDDGDSSRDDVNDEDKDEDDEEDEENYRIRIDCGLSARLVLKRGDMIRDVEYGFRGTWVVLAEDLYALLEDAQDSRSRISQRVDMDSQRVNLLMGDRIQYEWWRRRPMLLERLGLTR
ncbi:hypothetical protein Tco_0938808 [Tanacetum coccineum]|uniref:Uncharacterized protein n=1 Tax=Tanacetum coccineum TaxID=301880 RepID=A0ABQ5DK22_9ASTR